MPKIVKAVDHYPSQEYFPKDLPVSPLEPKNFLELLPIENREDLNKQADAAVGILMEAFVKQFVSAEEMSLTRWALVRDTDGSLQHYMTATWIKANAGVEILGDCEMLAKSIKANSTVAKALDVTFKKNPSSATSTNKLVIFFVRNVRHVYPKLDGDVVKAHKSGYEVIVVREKRA
jgi:hypothetical protein